MALGTVHTAQQRHARAAEAYRRVLAHDELQEDALRALMSALDQAGDRTAALRLYDRFTERLRKELKATPSAATVRIAHALRSTDMPA